MIIHFPRRRYGINLAQMLDYEMVVDERTGAEQLVLTMASIGIFDPGETIGPYLIPLEGEEAHAVYDIIVRNALTLQGSLLVEPVTMLTPAPALAV